MLTDIGKEWGIELPRPAKQIMVAELWGVEESLLHKSRLFKTAMKEFIS